MLKQLNDVQYAKAVLLGVTIADRKNGEVWVYRDSALMHALISKHSRNIMFFSSVEECFSAVINPDAYGAKWER